MVLLVNELVVLLGLKTSRLNDQSMSKFSNLPSLTYCKVASIQDFEFERCFLFQRRAQCSGEPQFRRILNCCVKECVVTHRLQTTDLVP
ncbi:MAG: hypothetical protein RL072_1504 [Actinomycetota bacterium]